VSTLEIKAELDSQEIAFDYSGADLQKPLSDLREHLLADARKLQEQLPPSSKELPTLGGLISKGPEADVKQKIKLVLSDAFEAQLWAAECKRTPAKVWRLNMSRLKWVYRYDAPT
jgi:hypothetical protein